MSNQEEIAIKEKVNEETKIIIDSDDEDDSWQYHPFFLNANTLKKVASYTDEELDKVDKKGYIKNMRSMLYGGTALDSMDSYRTQGNNALESAKSLLTKRGREKLKVSEADVPTKMMEYLDNAVSFYCEALKVPGIKDCILENIPEDGDISIRPISDTEAESISKTKVDTIESIKATETVEEKRNDEPKDKTELEKEAVKKANENYGYDKNDAASNHYFVTRAGMNERLGVIYSNRSEALRMAKNYPAAMSDAITSIILKKDWFRPYVRMGRIYEDTGDYFRAIGAYKKAYVLSYKDEVLKLLTNARKKLAEEKKKLKEIVQYEMEINNKLAKTAFDTAFVGIKNKKGTQQKSIPTRQLLKFGNSLNFYEIRQGSVKKCIYFDSYKHLTCDIYLCYPEMQITDMISEVDVMSTKWSSLVDMVMGQVSKDLKRPDYSPDKCSFWYREYWCDSYEEYTNKKGESDIRIKKLGIDLEVSKKLSDNQNENTIIKNNRTEEDLVTLEELMANKKQCKRRWVEVNFNRTVWETIVQPEYIIPICPTFFVLPNNQEIIKEFFSKDDELVKQK